VTIRGPFAVALLVLLFVSLAANLVVAGFAVARFAGPRPGGEVERIVALGIRAFPPELRPAITQGARDQRDKFRGLIENAQAARQRMFEAMRAEPFDKAKLEAAFADVRARTNDVQALGQTIVADAIASASPQTRSKIRPPRGPFP
jgi:uncharacterized membrane protein